MQEIASHAHIVNFKGLSSLIYFKCTVISGGLFLIQCNNHDMISFGYCKK